MGTFATLRFVSFTFLLSSCTLDFDEEDECEYEEQGCHGNTAVHCVDYQPLLGSRYRQRWQEECGEGTCIDGSYGIPFCALDEEPSPLCDRTHAAGTLGDLSVGSACLGNGVPYCRDGYVYRVRECEAHFCITAGDAAPFCALGPFPSPMCDGATPVACDGPHLPRCEAGYWTGSIECWTCSEGPERASCGG